MLIKYKSMPTGGASDRRLKKEVSPIKDALVKVLKLEPVTWKWKDGGGKVHYGFIAQDIEKILPELVSDEENKAGEVYKHVATGDIIPYLVAAINEQQEQFNKLRDELKPKE